MTVVASLSATELTGPPGAVVACDIEIMNPSSGAEVVGLQLFGPALGWSVGRPPTELLIGPGASERARLAFAVPAASDAGPGPVPFGVRIAAQELAGTITVAEVRSLRVRVSPLMSRTKGRKPVRHTVTVLNTGNVAAEGSLVVDGQELPFRVAPGGSSEHPIAAVPRSIGPNRVVVEAQADGSPVATGEALVIRDPLVTRRAKRVAVASTAAAAAVVALLALRPAPHPTTDAFSTRAAAAVPVGATPACPAPPGPADVPIAGFAFCPSMVTVAAGTEVRWVNTDLASHTVTAVNGSAAAFDSNTLAPGQAFILRFNVPGTYEYFCRFHPGMHATVVVT